jgi:hypothetical protein
MHQARSAAVRGLHSSAQTWFFQWQQEIKQSVEAYIKRGGLYAAPAGDSVRGARPRGGGTYPSHV